MPDIDINKFTGMNNVNPTFSNKSGVVPKILLNANPDESGRLVGRDGFELFLTLAGTHSLKAFDSCLLCAAEGKLYECSSGTATEITTIDGPTNEIDGHIDYVLCQDKIYISNLYWRGIFDPSDSSISDWGISVPSGPMLLTTTGNLPAGTYNVCLTNVVDGVISGNSPIQSITLSSEGGIEILNRPENAFVWVTDKNEPIFYFVGATDNIVNVPTVEPLPTFMCSPPLNMTNLCYAFGRIWGAVNNTLYCSKPYRLDLFNLNEDKFEFKSNITLIAKVPTGLFVGTEEETKFLAGTEPDKMNEISVGSGSVKGTLEYCNNVPYLADVLGTSEKVFSDVPIWRTHEGIVAGNITGRLFNLTKDKLRLGKVSQGASLHHQLKGYFTYLTSAVAANNGNIDAEILTALKNGQLTPNDIANKMLSSDAACSDEMSCEVWRGGERIY
ncbi:MAG: hypothetical protein SVO01_00165 [Thermotogota bacterium]|nr:hypothetical protein [Thermotogota bacterium]